MYTLEAALLPDPLRVEGITEMDETLVVCTRLTGNEARCPDCGHPRRACRASMCARSATCRGAVAAPTSA